MMNYELLRALACREKMNRIVVVQECDATDDDSSTEAGNIKNKTFNYKHVTKNIRIGSYIGDIGANVC